MNSMNFGNLNDWGIVLDKLETLSTNGQLNNCQQELIRVLRFNHNWRLREAAIESLPAVDKPDIALLREVYSLLMRKDLYYDVRILAADGLANLTDNVVKGGTVDDEQFKELMMDIVKGMDRLLACPEPPIFHDALRDSMDRIKNVEAVV